jgi:hypothetical protein
VPGVHAPRVAFTAEDALGTRPIGFWRFAQGVCKSLLAAPPSDFGMMGLAPAQIPGITTTAELPHAAKVYHDIYNGLSRYTRDGVTDPTRRFVLFMTPYRWRIPNGPLRRKLISFGLIFPGCWSGRPPLSHQAT